MYGKLLHTMRDNKIPHTMENHTMYEAYNVCNIQCMSMSAKTRFCEKKVENIDTSNRKRIKKKQVDE